MKKLVSIVLALAMILMVSAAFAGTITITPPTGLDANAQNTYTIYKVFDGVYSGGNISYRLVSGKTTAPTGFSVDSAGNVTYVGTTSSEDLTDDVIAAIRAYVTNADIVGTVTTTGSTASTSSDIGTGYFFIDTTTGTAVSIDSTTPDVGVNDKNEIPQLDKKITGATSVDDDGKKALAQVGTTVTYTATITVARGAKGYVFHDTMENGLTYKNDVKVYIGETEIAKTITTGEGTVTQWSDASTSTGDTFTVDFDDAYIATLNVGTVLKVVYSAVVNNNAITMDPLNNTAYVHYGDRNKNNHTPPSSADVYEAKFTVHKNQPANEGDEGAVLNSEDGKYYKPLAGAGFVVKKGNGYYKLTTTTTGEGTSAVTTNVVTWYELAENETLQAAITADKVTEYVSGPTGDVPAFTGLANGTYTLVESTVPAGFNKAADRQFTVEEHKYTVINLEQEATVTNNAGQELPSTGGIGTTIFYILGGLLVIGAAVILVARRKAQD